jgi:hypothetical protein
MKKVTILIAILVLAGIAEAQPGTLIPMPAFGKTYSSSMTRGMYCECPTDFTVVGLRVPDESNNGKQNVCLYTHTSAPPKYSGTVPLTPVFSKFGEPSANYIPCNVPYKKGEFMIVIGACGDSSKLHNSYSSSSAFPTTILGAATTLYRCGIQANIITTSTPHSVWSESGTICRVEVYVQPGATIVGSGKAQIGTPMAYKLTAKKDAGLPYQVGSSFGTGPIAIDTRNLGLSADTLLVLSVSNLFPTIFDQYTGLLDASGGGTATLNIPNEKALVGLDVHTAFITLLVSAPTGVNSISNTFSFKIM